MQKFCIGTLGRFYFALGCIENKLYLRLFVQQFLAVDFVPRSKQECTNF